MTVASRHSPRRFVLLLGAFTVGLLATAAYFHRRAFLREYHLWKLRKAPALFESMLLADGSRNAAALKFLREPEGRRSLFRLYLLEFDRSPASLDNTKYLHRLHRMGVRYGCLALTLDSYSCHTTSGKGGSSFSIGNVPENRLRRERILSLLDCLVGEPFRLPEFPGFEFRVCRVRDRRLDAAPWPGSGRADWKPTPILDARVRHACIFRLGPGAF